MDYGYIPRKIDQTLLTWKQDKARHPILLNGARTDASTSS
jgi:hypothetical protein